MRTQFEAQLAQCDVELRKTTEQLETRIGLHAQLKMKHEEIAIKHAALLRDFGRWRITYCGSEAHSFGLTVAVQFIDHHDVELAKQIRGFFHSEFPGMSAYKVPPVEPIQWRENPSTRARIVIFSGHKYADGIKAAFNDCELLPEKVDRYERRTDMQADITIIIFDKIAKET
jgi:hypothetical protein